MAPIILDGKRLALEIQSNVRTRVSALIERSGKIPALATILVGDDPASVTYVRMKGNACKRVGIRSVRITLPDTATTDDVLSEIKCLNADPAVTGILLQHPVPEQIDEQACFNAIAFEKDADGVGIASFGAMAMKLPGPKSATPFGIMALLEHYGIKLSGKRAVVVGRSPILGKPAALMLLNADATVTICHTKTVNLPEEVKRADIVVAAVGRPRFVKADWIKDGAVLVDAGYNKDENGQYIGDIDLEAAAARSYAYTPVPGGVGPMTIVTLIEQTVLAAERSSAFR